MTADAWIPQQKRCFTAWVNSQLLARRVHLDRDLATAFDDGLHLIPLAEILTKDKCPRHVAKPKMRIHQVVNVKLAMGLLEKHGFVPDIHTEMFVDGNEKMILGFIWQLFARFGANEAGGSSADLLKWVQERVNNNPRYPNVNVKDFSKTFQDGLAFNALLDSFTPDFVDYTTVPQGPDDDKHTNQLGNLNRAFDSGQKDLNVPKLLEANDFVAMPPDDKSVKMYIQMLKNAWEDRGERLAAEKRAKQEAEAARRAAMSKEEALAELEKALEKLKRCDKCPECQFDLTHFLAEREAKKKGSA